MLFTFVYWQLNKHLGKRAVDALLDSKFTKGESPLFTTRQEIVDYLHLMLEHKLYHRARKVPVSEQGILQILTLRNTC